MMKKQSFRAWLAWLSALCLLMAPTIGFTAVAEDAVDNTTVTYTLGNVDEDEQGEVTANDALLALQAATNKITLSDTQKLAADVDADAEGVVSANDALLILQYATKKIAGFPAGEQVIRTSGNPIFTDIFTADPSAHVWSDGRLYVYPSQDQFPANGCDYMDKYHVYSTTNMVDWYDHGQILSAEDVQEQAGWGMDGFMWAPDAAYKDGQYYFFFPHPVADPEDGHRIWRVGVAVSDQPASGFKVVTQKADGTPYNGYIEGITYEDYTTLIDPCIFEDDDGKFYLFIGGGQHCYMAELTDDLLAVKEGTWREITEELRYSGEDRNPNGDSRDFHEGAWVFKRNDTYYLMYPDNKSGGNEMRYATATSINGPWTAHTESILPGVTSDTSHGSIVEYKDHWYMFYHTGDLSGGAGNLRSVCVAEVVFNEDGTIQPIEPSKDGVEAIGPDEPEPPEGATAQKGVLIINDETIEGYKATYTQGYEYNLNFATLGVDLSKVPEDKLNEDGTPKEVPAIAMTNGITHTKMLTAPGAYIQFDGIVGGLTDGKALLEVHYSSGDNPNFQVKTNAMPTGIDGHNSYYMRMGTTGSWSEFTGVAYCLIDLKAGADNSIWMAQGTGGGANFTSIKVYLPADNVDPTLEPKDPTVVDYTVYTGPATVYTMDTAVLGTTNPEAETPVYRTDTQAVHNMERNGAYVDVPNVDGGKGGKAMVTIEYASANVGSLTLTANGKALDQGSNLTFVSTETWSNYQKTLIGQVELNAGTDNTIRLTGGSGGYNIKSITVTLLPQD